MRRTLSVINCCGVNGLDGFSPTKSTNLKEFSRLGITGGAFMMATTSCEQPRVKEMLEEFGFQNVGKEYNSNSGNEVTVWLMQNKQYNEQVLVIQKITNNPAFTSLKKNRLLNKINFKSRAYGLTPKERKEIGIEAQ